MDISVTSTEFQTRAGQYIEGAAKAPVFITRYNRPIRVLVDIDEYNRLKSYDTRESLYMYELGDDMKAELEKGYQGREMPELNHLME